MINNHEPLAKIAYTKTMKKIIVASHNPVKIKAATDGIQRLFPDQTFVVESVDVPSGVSEQPFHEEILFGC